MRWLAIARRAVVLHKGTLTARNMNPGLLVVMELPAVRVTPPSGARANPADPALAPDPYAFPR